MNWDHNRSWLEDRFMLFLVLAIAVHALLLLGVSFGITIESPPRLADTLDVVLVNWRTEDEPEEADFLAQASQLGGGEATEKARDRKSRSEEGCRFGDLLRSRCQCEFRSK